MHDDLPLLTDSYKITHWALYPPGTTRVQSYFESRGGPFDEIVFFGLQDLLLRYLAGVRVDHAALDRAQARLRRHFGRDLFHAEGWRRIVDECGGRLPVRIRAVAEGTPLPPRQVMLTIENTRDFAFWLPNVLETLLVQVWYPSTVATISREAKRRIGRHLVETGGEAEELLTKLHDFGFRGATSVESAGRGGLAHLVNFRGTDTLAALEVAEASYDEPDAGVSIPATEHSVMTLWGEAREAEACARALEAFPEGLLSVVSDSYDVYRCCAEVWGRPPLRDRVLARDGAVVVRPDSGDPLPVTLRCLEILGERFGARANEAGFRELPPQLRLIWGDGLNLERLETLLEGLREAGWATGNLTFGMGGGLLQKMDRDTLRFAFKTCWAEIGGEGRGVSKDPATDPGKRSKAGRLKLVRGADGLATVAEDAQGEDLLAEVFRDGELTRRQTLAEVRARARLPFGDRWL